MWYRKWHITCWSHVYISLINKVNINTGFSIKTGGKGGVTKMSPGQKKKCIFCILSFINYFSYLIALLIENDSISCWWPSVDMIGTKNGEDICIVPVWQKCPLPCIRSVNTGATLFLPYTCYGANCLREEYDQCLNTANIAPWVYHTLILQSGSALWVPRNEPEPEELA